MSVSCCRDNIRFVTDKDLQTLKENTDRVVRIKTYDGEVMLAKVIIASDREQDLIYDLISTSKESQYAKDDVQPAGYLIPFKDIESVEAVNRE
jgi:hypothetical protein